MLKARPDRKNPLASSGAMPATMIGSRSADRIRAAVICAANAVHMSAPAEKQHAKKTLATGEPSTHEAEQFQPSSVNLMVSLSNDGVPRFLSKGDPNVCVALHRKMQRW